MERILFTLFDEALSIDLLAKELQAKRGEVEIRPFPDGETYLRILDDVKGKHVILVASLNQANKRLAPILFFSEVIRSLGAASLGLVAPYLGYMRQDKQFHEGEAVTSKFFAKCLSGYFDWMLTVDPHLHRFSDLHEIYSIPTKVVQSASSISTWIRNHVKKPIIIGPDSESAQWVKEVATQCEAPFEVLTKTRQGDKQVQIKVKKSETFSGKTPILIDDIVSTASTMIAAVKLCFERYQAYPICIGVHALFVEHAYKALEKAGATQIVTCNTVPHISNQIDLTSVIASALNSWIDAA